MYTHHFPVFVSYFTSHPGGYMDSVSCKSDIFLWFYSLDEIMLVEMVIFPFFFLLFFKFKYYHIKTKQDTIKTVYFRIRMAECFHRTVFPFTAITILNWLCVFTIYTLCTDILQPNVAWEKSIFPLVVVYSWNLP